MKKVISGLCMVGVVLAGDLKIGLGYKAMPNNQNAYALSCDGAQGTVKYYVDGLPNGVEFDGTTIVISNWAKAGNYTVRIRAIDQIYQSAERVITLSISQSSYSGQGQVGQTGQTGQAGQLGQAGQAGQGGMGGQGNQGGQGGKGANGGAQQPGGAGQQPGAGQPGSGQPSGGSPSGGSPNNGRLNDILSAYPSSGAPSTPNYGNSGRYPEPNFPATPDPNLFNPFPAQIGSDQAPRTPANRNPVTPDDVALRAASERHQNAIKGITNLLKIIDQAKANKDKAQSDIQTYTQAYNDAVASQRAAQNDIITAENKVSQITSAINSLTTTIDDLRNRITQSAAQREGYTKEKLTIVATITTQEGKKADLLEQLKNLDNQVGQRVKQLSDKTSECQSLDNALANKSKQLGAAQQELANSEGVRANIVIEINNKNALVDDIRRQLQQAEKDLADAKIRLADIDAKRLALPVQIANLRKELEDLQARAKSCFDQVTNLNNIINSLKSSNYTGLTKDIGDLDAKIGASRTRVSEIDAQLAASQGPLEDLKAKLSQASEDLSFLRNQKVEGDGNLRIAYQRGNDSNNRVAFAKQNIDAIIKRFQDESKIVSDATLNLERARAEEALARLGLEQIIAHYSDALPYAIVPNGNGLTNPGSPNGNNPSGSPLGPIKTDGNGAPGGFKINSWTNYLSAAYGAGVNPSFPGSVTELFPFNFLSNVSGNMAQGTNVLNPYGNIRGQAGSIGLDGRPIRPIVGPDSRPIDGAIGGGCGGQSNLGQKVAVGVVVAVRADSFDIKAEDGQIYTIRVAPCTRLNANKPNYTMRQGSQAIVKGNLDQYVQRAIQGDQITCLEA